MFEVKLHKTVEVLHKVWSAIQLDRSGSCERTRLYLLRDTELEGNSDVLAEHIEEYDGPVGIIRSAFPWISKHFRERLYTIKKLH